MLIKDKWLNTYITMKRKEFLFWIIFGYIFGWALALLSQSGLLR